MLTKDDVEQIAKLLKPIKEQLTDQGKKLDTLDLEVEAIHAQNKKDHAEIMDKLETSNEISGKQLKDHETRISHLEDGNVATRSH